MFDYVDYNVLLRLRVKLSFANNGRESLNSLTY